MALQKDITDEKGVKTRYHAVRRFECEGNIVTITLRSYVNQATRDAEKNALANNKKVVEYNDLIDKKQAEMDALLTQPNDEGQLDEQIQALAAEINNLQLSPDRPAMEEVVDRYYSEQQVFVSYEEPITKERLYQKIVSDIETFNGATLI